MPSFYRFLNIHDYHFSLQYTTSWAFRPLILAIIRLLFALYAFIVIFATYGLQPAGIGRSFSFFTELTYWGIAFYALVAGTHTLVYALRGRCWLDRWPRPLQALHGLYYTTIIVFPFLVTIVYWAILYSEPYYSQAGAQWRDISKHGLNSLVALFELIFPDTVPPPLLYLAGVVLILALYLALAYVTHATQGFYPYTFLDPKNGGGILAGYIVGILAAACVIFLIVWGLVWLRMKYTPPGKRSKFDDAYGQSTDVEMSTTRPTK